MAQTLTHNRLDVEDVRKALEQLEETKLPFLREISRVLKLEDLCRDWLDMRAAQAPDDTK